MSRRWLRVRALEQQGALRGTRSYKAREEPRLGKMERARKVEENGITRLKLTREGAKSLPPFPRPPRGKVSNSEGEEGVLSGAEDRERGGVSRSCSRIGQLGRWSHGRLRAGQSEQSGAAAWHSGSERADGTKKTTPTGGPRLAATQPRARDHEKWGDASRWIEILRSTLREKFYNPIETVRNQSR